MIKDTIWNEYKDKSVIGNGTYGLVYKAFDLNSKNYVAIKEIDKKIYHKINNSNFKENMKKINSKIKFYKEIIETKEKFYIIMDLCLCNLEDYLYIRKEPLSIDEIREILIQLNEILKITEKENIIFKDLKPSNILITYSKIDEIEIKLCKISKNELIDNTKSNSIEGICFTTAPEILKGESISKKCDLWSLGIIIYYLLFKEYPYNGKTEYQILNQINSNKILKNIHEKELNDLIYRMLKINENERITWNNYFIHNFFKKDSIKQKLLKENNELKNENERIIKEKNEIKNENKRIIKENNELKNENKRIIKENNELKIKKEELINEIQKLKKENEKMIKDLKEINNNKKKMKK